MKSKCPYASLREDRYGNPYVCCEKYEQTFDDEDHINAYCLAGEPCDIGIFDW